MTEYAVEVRDLVKRYPKSPRNAVDGLSFAVRRGEVFGLLGPNGAGKSTTVAVLTTRALPTSGQAMVAGLDVVADAVRVRSRLAVVPQRVNLDRSLNVRDNLVFHAAYHGMGRAERNRRADELLERMGLQDKAKAMPDGLSGGQSQRVMIARGLMHRPEVLFLDEPSTGLDPQARLFVHEQIASLRSEGVTVVLTTHDMDEAEKLSDRVGIVDQGKLLTLDTPANLMRALPGSATIEVTVATEEAPETLVGALNEITGVQRIEVVTTAVGVPGGLPGGVPPGVTPAMLAPSGGAVMAPPAPEVSGARRLRLYVDAEPAALVGPVVTLLAARGANVLDLSLGTPSLEDVFISLTGRDLR